MSALNVLDSNKQEIPESTEKAEEEPEIETLDDSITNPSDDSSAEVEPQDIVEEVKSDEFESIKNNCYCCENEKNGEQAIAALTESAKKPNIICFTCKSEFHQECISLLSNWSEPPMIGDAFYWYYCSKCKLQAKPENESDLLILDELRRLSLTWIDVVTIALLNLNYTNPIFTLDDEDNKFYHKNEICDFIEENWERFWVRSKGMPWKGSVTACLSTSTHRFRSLSEGLFALDTLEPAHKQCEQPLLIAQKRHITCLIAGDGTLVDIDEGKPLRKRRQEVNMAEVDIFDRLEELDANGKKRKRSLKFDYENIDPSTAIMLYPDLDNPSDEHVHMSLLPTHTAPQVTVFTDKLTVSNEKGYRMAKASHGVWEGHWYFEVMLNNTVGHTRIGWSQISGDLQAPCGYDIFSYSFRDAPGCLFHNSRAAKDAPPAYEGGYKAGDVLGVSIYIPKQKRKPKDCAVDEQLLRRMWDPERMDQYVPLKSKPLAPIPRSYIEFFKNGNSLGRAFENINFGKYHPAVSLYGGASAAVNFGPDFIFMPLDNSQPFSKVYYLKTWEESIIEHKQMMEGTLPMKEPGGDSAIASSSKHPGTNNLQNARKPPTSHSRGNSSSNTKSNYSEEEKKEIVQYGIEHSQADASRKFNVHKSMVSRWTQLFE